MPTYLIKSEKTITRQEGDTADIIITVPVVLDMSLYDVSFKVINNSGVTIMSKTSAEGTITIAGQIITIPLAAIDTKRKFGNHRWEMELNNDTPEVITIGRGAFVVINKLIR